MTTASAGDGDRSPGRILTFYSFKGGTGRTMALANVAYLLAAQGKSVLTIDFDLEAPGLSTYFESSLAGDFGDKPGMIDLLTDVRSPDHAREIWTDYRQRVPGAGQLDVVTSGRRDDRFAAKVMAMKWDEFFADREGGEVLEALRDCWSAAYDYVLIDSRTGYTDTGGICTIHLPDAIVPLCTPNKQSLEGVVQVVTRAQRQRLKLAHERGPALVFPLVSRLDDRDEKVLGAKWMGEAEKHLAPFFDSWLPESIPVRRILERTKLPYITYYSFGEQMPAKIDHPDDPASLRSALQTVTDVITAGFENLFEILGERPTVASTPPPIAVAFEQVTAGDVGTTARAVAVLARLVEPGDLGRESSDEMPPAQLVAVPADLVGDDDIVGKLGEARIIDVQQGMVTVADEQSFLTFDPLKDYLRRYRQVWRWAHQLRRSVLLRVDLVLDGEMLSEALTYLEDSPQALTPFERRIIEESIVGRGPERSLPPSVIAVWAFVGALLGLVVGALLPHSGPVEQGLDAVVGGGSGVWAALLGRMLIRGRYHRDVSTVWVKSGWFGIRALADILRPQGYEAEAHGALVIFRLADEYRNWRLTAARLLGMPLDRRDLAVLVRVAPDQHPDDSRPDFVEYVVTGPRGAVRSL